jgi:glutathionylspermidine synthase
MIIKRVLSQPRVNWKKRLEEGGLSIHSINPDGTNPPDDDNVFRYWREDVKYQLSEKLAFRISEASETIHSMMVYTLDKLIKDGNLARLGYDSKDCYVIENSWNQAQPDMLGRFDFCFNNDTFAMIEYNADVPAMVNESSIAQGLWSEDLKLNQYNDLWNAIGKRLKWIVDTNGFKTVHFTSLKSCEEDIVSASTLYDIAVDQGIESVFTFIEDIACSNKDNYMFCDGEDNLIEFCVKHYNWYQMTPTGLGSYLNTSKTKWLEPAWKGALANKALLAEVWENNKTYPFILPTTTDPTKLPSHPTPSFKKCFNSCEGTGVSYNDWTKHREDYVVYQQAFQQKNFTEISTKSTLPLNGIITPSMGVWIVDGQCEAINFREDTNIVTGKNAFFVPHELI